MYTRSALVFDTREKANSLESLATDHPVQTSISPLSINCGRTVLRVYGNVTVTCKSKNTPFLHNRYAHLRALDFAVVPTLPVGGSSDRMRVDRMLLHLFHEQ